MRTIILISKMRYNCLKSVCVALLLLFGFSAAYSQTEPKKKILIVATSSDNLLNKPNDHSWGCYTPEIIGFVGVLYESGVKISDIDIVSPLGGKVPLAVNSRFPKRFDVPKQQQDELIEKLEHSLSPTDIKPDDYDIVFYAGGFSCLMDYPKSDDIAKIASQVYENGGVIGAVCDGVSGLIPIKLKSGKYLVDGKTIVSNGGFVQDSLKERHADIGTGKTAVSERLITAKGVREEWVAHQVLRLSGLLPYVNKKI